MEFRDATVTQHEEGTTATKAAGVAVPYFNANTDIQHAKKKSVSNEVSISGEAVFREAWGTAAGGAQKFWCCGHTSEATVYGLIRKNPPCFYGTEPTETDPYILASLNKNPEMRDRIRTTLDSQGCILLFGGDGMGKRTRALNFARGKEKYRHVFYFDSMEEAQLIVNLGAFTRKLCQNMGHPIQGTPRLLSPRTLHGSTELFQDKLGLLKEKYLIILANNESTGNSGDDMLLNLKARFRTAQIDVILISYHELSGISHIEICGLREKELLDLFHTEGIFKREKDLQSVSPEQIKNLNTGFKPKSLVEKLQRFDDSECSLEKSLNIEEPSMTTERSPEAADAAEMCQKMIARCCSKKISQHVNATCCDILMWSSCLKTAIPKRLLFKLFMSNRPDKKRQQEGVESDVVEALRALSGFYVTNFSNNKAMVTVNRERQEVILRCFNQEEKERCFMPLTELFLDSFQIKTKEGNTDEDSENILIFFPQIQHHLDYITKNDFVSDVVSQLKKPWFSRRTDSEKYDKRKQWVKAFMKLLVCTAKYRASNSVSVSSDFNDLVQGLLYGLKWLENSKTDEIFADEKKELHGQLLIQLSTAYALSNQPEKAFEKADQVEILHAKLLKHPDVIQAIYTKMDIRRIQGRLQEAYSMMTDVNLSELLSILPSCYFPQFPNQFSGL